MPKAAKPLKSQRQKKQTDAEAATDAAISTLNKLLGFRQFLNSGFEPTISDVEIVVCFADVRGFTAFCRKLQKEMQDRKIQNFLRSFFKIFVEGLVVRLSQQPGKTDTLKDFDHDLKKIEPYLVPASHKGLGDGVMLVWEIPGSIDTRLQGVLTQQIVYYIQEIENRFYHHFRNLIPVELDAYSNDVEQLSIGFGVAKGHAWRLDFGHTVDYAGSIINLASRLEAAARPKGIVAHYEVSPWLFDQLTKEGIGTISLEKEIKGYDDGEVRVWRHSESEPSLESESKKPRKRKNPSKARPPNRKVTQIPAK